MAEKIVVSCDRTQEPPCDHRVVKRIEVKTPGRRFHADLCQEDLLAFEDMLLSFGFAPKAWAHGQEIEGFIAASGRIFTGADARAWLIEQGYDVKDRGRLSEALRDLYAEAH